MNIQSIPNFPRKAMPLLAVALMAAALAGCGSDTTASKMGSDPTQAVSAATQPDSTGAPNFTGLSRKPCEYMARADAEAAVGQPLPKASENIPLGMCGYSSNGFDSHADVTMGDWDGIKAAATGGGPHSQPTAISGVGDEALNINEPGTGSILYVRKGDRGLLLTLDGPNVDRLPDRGLEQEKALALKILANF